MGGSAEAPTLPDGQPVNGLRASDAERNEVVVKLTEEYAAGRLSHDTFLFRMDAVLRSRHQSDLPRLLADLPPAPGSATPAPAAPGALIPGSPPPGAATPGRVPPAPGGPSAGPRSLASRLRALPRRVRSVVAQPRDPAARTPRPRAGARRLTAAMSSADSPARRPAPLQFPRGEATLFSIGRDASCDLAIADMTVSRFHARLERAPDGWLLTDLSSTNGTRVNGWLVRDQVPVRAGDLVSFGKVEYWLIAPDGS